MSKVDNSISCDSKRVHLNATAAFVPGSELAGHPVRRPLVLVAVEDEGAEAEVVPVGPVPRTRSTPWLEPRQRHLATRNPSAALILVRTSCGPNGPLSTGSLDNSASDLRISVGDTGLEPMTSAV